MHVVEQWPQDERSYFDGNCSDKHNRWPTATFYWLGLLLRIKGLTDLHIFPLLFQVRTGGHDNISLCSGTDIRIPSPFLIFSVSCDTNSTFSCHKLQEAAMNFPPACHSHSQSRLAAPQSRENKNWAYHITCPLLYAHVYRKTQSLKLYCGNYRIPTRLPPGADTLFEITQSHLSNCQQWQHTLANLDLLSKGQKSLLFKRTSLKHTMKHYNSRLTLYSYETHLH